MSLVPIEDYSVLITGGGSGIGAGAAEYLATRGARVTISGRRAEKLQEVVDRVDGAVHAVCGDVGRPDDRERMVAEAVAFGGRLDGLVNNAGNMYRGPLATLETSALENIFRSNVIAPMLLTGLAQPHLAARGGAVVFIGSVHNRRAFPGVSPYAATKGAIEALTRSLAAELGADGIRVNCVCPGAVFTEINQRAGLFTDDEALARLQGMSGLHALGRIGETEEIAEAIAYFLQARWTTGAIMDVDGGLGLGLTEG